MTHFETFQDFLDWFESLSNEPIDLGEATEIYLNPDIYLEDL